MVMISVSSAAVGSFLKTNMFNDIIQVILRQKIGRG